MLSIAHGVTGAFIASKVSNPLLSIPLCLAAHYLEDAIPHWDVGQGISSKKKQLKTAFLQELFFDFPLSLILSLPFIITHPNPLIPLMGWFICLLPDFLEFPYLFLNMRFFPITQLAAFHEWVHRSTTNRLLGILPQIIVILTCYILK